MYCSWVGMYCSWVGMYCSWVGRCVMFMGRCVLFMGRCVLFMGGCVLFMGRCVLFVGRYVLQCCSSDTYIANLLLLQYENVRIHGLRMYTRTSLHVDSVRVLCSETCLVCTSKGTHNQYLLSEVLTIRVGLCT